MFFHPSDPQRQASGQLSDSQGEVLADAISEASARPFPLAEGLQAASREVRDPAVAASLRAIAGRVESGSLLADALREARPSAPAYLQGLIQVADATGRLPLVLASVVASRQRCREISSRVWFPMAYPLVVLMLTLLIMVLVNGLCLQPIGEMIRDFGLSPPPATLAAMWWQDQGMWHLAGLVLGMLIMFGMARLTLTAHRRHQLLAAMPLFGTLFRWTGAVEWARLMSILLEHHMPMPEALRMTGAGLRDRSMGSACSPLAAAVERGESLARALAAVPIMPAWLIPMSAWGERQRCLPLALRQAADDLELLAEQRADALSRILPGFLIVLCFVLIVGLIYSMFLPLQTLLLGLQ